MSGSAWFSRWLRTKPTPTRADGSANPIWPPAPMWPNAPSLGPCIGGAPGTSAGGSSE